MALFEHAGILRDKIIIEHVSLADDGSGGTTPDWTTFITVRASREHLVGNEYFAAKQEQSEIDTRFRIRYYPGITSAMRVNYDGTYYDIISVTDPERPARGRWLILYCKLTSEQN